jgi:leader peptidase (prepilin peptidase) / N-methyltransferase
MMALALAFGLFGLLIGSFLNVCISRLPQDLSIVVPRSYCTRCGTPIAWYDNIPLLSYLILGGRCRACKLRISLRYPLVELLTGLSFAWAIYTHGPTWPGFRLAAISAILIELMFSDLESRILPDEFTKGGMLLGLFLSPIVLLPPGLSTLFFPQASPELHSFLESITGGMVAGVGLWLVGEMYRLFRGREGLGFGDVKLVTMMGLMLGLEAVLLVLIVGSVAGSVIGLIWIKVGHKDPATYELPFGFFLGAAGLAAAFWTSGSV